MNKKDMKKIIVNTKSKKYPVYIGKDIIKKHSFKELKNKNVFVVFDNKVRRLHEEKVMRLFSQSKSVKKLSFSFSEKNKNISFCEKIFDSLIKNGACRMSLIVVVGGGVAGDVVGFVSSVFMRGVPFVHVPTTLLAQVDSSIGGKTGINLVNAKNSVGTITQPESVIVDTTLLQTLPQKQIKEGVAEVIKYAVIEDSKFFDFLKKNHDKIDNLDVLEKIVLTCVKIKSRVVGEDEHEHGLREILNYGHTIGHAIEICSDHKFSHGEAISVGMIEESRLARKLNILSDGDFQKIVEIFALYKMKTKTKILTKDLLKVMKNDKKNKDGEIMFVLPVKIGAVLVKKGKYSLGINEKDILNNIKTAKT